MTLNEPSFEELNAYVDNELPADRAADIAKIIAADRVVAEKVAVLAGLRSVVAETADAPADLRLPASGSPWRRRMPWLAAACLLLALLVGGLSTVLFYQPGGEGRWLQAAWRLHDGWEQPPSMPAEAPLRRTIGASVEESDLVGAYVPDLSAAKLTLVFADLDRRLAGAPAIAIGYVGSRGCKLTLITAETRGRLTEVPQFFEQAPRVAYGWRAGRLDYLLIAQGMARGRLELIADSVRRASLERQPFDDETRLALLESRRKSKPCRA
jgi:hypothetical protein